MRLGSGIAPVRDDEEDEPAQDLERLAAVVIEKGAA